MYSDKFIDLSDTEIIVHGYYFPFGGDKCVPLDTVESVRCVPSTLRTGAWRIQGTGGFSTWFAHDLRRPTRDKIFLMTVRDAYWRIGFTVEDSDSLRKIFKEKGLLVEDDPPPDDMSRGT